MSETKRKVPKLRFPGFTEDWEQRKLGELYERVNERNDGTLGRDKWISVAKMYFQNPDKVQSNNLDTRTYVMQRGDIAFEGHPNNEFKFGRFVLNDIGTGIISELFPIYRPIVRYDLNFWKYAIQLERTMAPIFAKSITSSGNSSNKLDQNHFLQQSITIPTVEEQKVIGSFLENISNLITLHQRKLENLKLKKKALLQKMFPKNGEQFPELRFPGFTDAWEQRKLGEIVEFLDGCRKPLKESDRIKGNYPYYGASGIIDYINDYLFDEDLILLSEDGANIIDRNYPVCFMATGKYWVNNHAHVLKPKLGMVDKFICESLENQDYAKYNTGTAQPKLNKEVCQKIEISLPNEEEQKYISIFLEKIAHLITLHQRKLEHLQLQKKSLLQQMFV